MKVYLAGPMRGISELNYPEFDRLARVWEETGHQVFSPAWMDQVLGYVSDYADDAVVGEVVVDPAALRHMISVDIVCILAADAIVLLPEWKGSSGVTVELALAQFLGMPVYDALTMERIYPESRPWSLLKKEN